MKSSFYHKLILFSCFIFLKCSSGHKLHEQTGDDFEKLIKKTEQDPGNENIITLLNAKYNNTRQAHISKIQEILTTTSVLNNELALKEYSGLQQLYNRIAGVPGLMEKINPQNYSDQIESLKNKIQNQLNEEAGLLLKQGDKISCRTAYYNLVKLQSYQPANKSINDGIIQSLKCAAINIYISDPVIDSKLSYYTSEIGEFCRNLNSVIKQKSFSPFVLIEETHPDIDESIRIYFTNFETGNVTKDNNSREVVNNAPYSTGGRRSTTAGTGTAPSSATITTIRSTSASTAAIRVEILNKTGLILDKQEFAALHEWNNETNTYSGDRRALTSGDRAQLRNPVKNIPAKNEITDNLLNQLSEKILNYLQNRYTDF